jgi:hypothetical protein
MLMDSRRMKSIALISSAAILSISPIFAEPVTISFEATVDYIEDTNGALNGKLNPGSTITGKYTYDPAQTDSNPSPEVGDYEFDASPFGITLNLANTIVGTAPNGNFLIETVNDYNGTDNFLLRSYENTSSDKALAINHISWQLDDPTMTALSSDALPSSPPNLANFQSWFGINVEGTNGSFFLAATVTKITTGPQLFLPAVSILPASGQLVDTQNFEPVVKADIPASRETKIEKILLDGEDVTGRMLGKVRRGILAGDNPGQTWRLKGLDLPAGEHELQVDLRLDDEKTISTKANWEVLDTIEHAPKPNSALLEFGHSKHEGRK